MAQASRGRDPGPASARGRRARCRRRGRPPSTRVGQVPVQQREQLGLLRGEVCVTASATQRAGADEGAGGRCRGDGPLARGGGEVTQAVVEQRGAARPLADDRADGVLFATGTWGEQRVAPARPRGAASGPGPSGRHVRELRRALGVVRRGPARELREQPELATDRPVQDLLVAHRGGAAGQVLPSRTGASGRASWRGGEGPRRSGGTSRLGRNVWLTLGRGCPDRQVQMSRRCPDTCPLPGRLEPARRPLVEVAVEVLVEDRAEHRLVGCGGGEQRHRRLQLLGVHRSEHPARDRRCRGRSAPGRTRAGAGGAAGGPGTPPPPRGRRSRSAGPSGCARPDLRKDEPHPVAVLAAGLQFAHGLVVDAPCPARRRSAGARRGRSPLAVCSPGTAEHHSTAEVRRTHGRRRHRDRARRHGQRRGRRTSRRAGSGCSASSGSGRRTTAGRATADRASSASPTSRTRPTCRCCCAPTSCGTSSRPTPAPT